MKSHNNGQGKSGGSLNTPSNIPDKMGGKKFGTPVEVNSHQSPKETKEAGLGGPQTGSNKSNYVY